MRCKKEKRKGAKRDERSAGRGCTLWVNHRPHGYHHLPGERLLPPWRVPKLLVKIHGGRSGNPSPLLRERLSSEIRLFWLGISHSSTTVVLIVSHSVSIQTTFSASGPNRLVSSPFPSFSAFLAFLPSSSDPNGSCGSWARRLEEERGVEEERERLKV